MPGSLSLRSVCASFAMLISFARAADDTLLQSFQRDVQPVLQRYCYDCHGDGMDKGGVRLDGFTTAAELRDPTLWSRALRNVRAKIMPPAEEEPLPDEHAEKLMEWIKREAFRLDPAKPDPGRMTLRRLNRVEYRNTIRDLTGVEFDTQKEFPADDTGHGFDNIADVLTISPMLLERYLDAAQAVVTKSVPLQSRVVAETLVAGRRFATVHVDTTVPELPPQPAAPPPPRPQGRGARGQPFTPPPMRRPAPTIEGDALDLSYYTPAIVTAKHQVAHAGKYQLTVELRTFERYVDNQFDLNRCQVLFKVDGETLLDQEFVREGGKKFEFTFEREWTAGEHELTFEIRPLTPTVPQIRQLRLRLAGVTVRGPLAEEFWVKPPGYEKVFPRAAPVDVASRREYAREVLTRFATRAYRRPADPIVVDRLVALAESVYGQPGKAFEAGIAQAMVAVLASPSFIFREEQTLPIGPGEAYPLVDEYALASRLSYFLWSTMPDEELFRLAGEGRLRAELPRQVARMLRDARSRELVRNFTGQWLQARDISLIAINALDVYLRDHPHPQMEEARAVFRSLQGKPPEQRTPEEAAAVAQARSVFAEFNRQPKPELNDELRKAMQLETELSFAHVLQEDRSLLELVDSDYTFLNEPLAKHYGIEGVTGREMRKVTLPPGSPRGGVLTQGTVLAVTSNPNRTSPVKRGVFILEAILGTPPAPPPPNIPSLEDAASPEELRVMSLRDTLALHAKNPSCRSCHSRMDPLGLALENFNALGVWRTRELDQPIEPAGKLITGETFSDIRELKRVLATERRHDFYHSISEKLLTYALGRGLEYYDTLTLDTLVAELEASGGKPSALLHGIINSAAFQRRRPSNPSTATTDAAPPGGVQRLVGTQP